MKSTVELSTEQQAAMDAATKAGGIFYSDELLESTPWCEALIRSNEFFQEHLPEWIAGELNRNIHGSPRHRVSEISDSLYKEIEQRLVDIEVEIIRKEPNVLFELYLLPSLRDKFKGREL